MSSVTSNRQSLWRSASYEVYTPQTRVDITAQSEIIISAEGLTEPPKYQRQPAHPVTYSFSALAHNTMLLIPPPDALDTQPLYHISVHLDCFNPLTHITYIRRGGFEHGDMVADIVMGLSSNQSTYTSNGNEEATNQTLFRRSVVGAFGKWQWKLARNKDFMRWDCTGWDLWRCTYSTNKASVLAVYHRARPHRKRGVTPVLRELLVQPAGQHYFDEILVSLLVLERKLGVAETGRGVTA